jgi:hypothetical protein
VLVLEREGEFKDRVRGEALVPWNVAEAQELGSTICFAKRADTKRDGSICFLVGANHASGSGVHDAPKDHGAHFLSNASARSRY